jgi:hypothetical protein
MKGGACVAVMVSLRAARGGKGIRFVPRLTRGRNGVIY